MKQQFKDDVIQDGFLNFLEPDNHKGHRETCLVFFTSGRSYVDFVAALQSEIKTLFIYTDKQ